MEHSDVLQPVFVRSKSIDPDRLPDWANLLWWLPPFTGFKGGIARKILKVILGGNHAQEHFRAEKSGSCDVDFLVYVEQLDDETRKMIRRSYAGTTVGEGMRIEAKDIEVCDCLSRFFLTRDVTMNECLVMRTGELEWSLLYSDQAALDTPSGTIRPSVHCLHTGYSQVWQFGNMGRQVITSKLLTRSIIRYLKGHGTRYAIDPDSLLYHSEQGLRSADLWRILRHFHNDEDAFRKAYDHLAGLGFIHEPADPNRHWGVILFETNLGLARNGARLKFGEPNLEQIEDWIKGKKAEHEEWKKQRERASEAGEDVEPDEAASVYLPPVCNAIEVFQQS